MPYTLGFNNAWELSDHFDTHVTIQQEFVMATEAEYLAAADTFMGEPLNSTTTDECIRKCRDGSDGDRVRYNRITHELGIISNTNRLRSYFRARPRLVTGGWGHQHPTNGDYFVWNCGRILC